MALLCVKYCAFHLSAVQIHTSLDLLSFHVTLICFWLKDVMLKEEVVDVPFDEQGNSHLRIQITQNLLRETGSVYYLSYFNAGASVFSK